MTRSRTVRLAAPLLAALTITACSGSDVPDVPDIPDVPSIEAPDLSLPSELPTELPVDTNAELPAGFPVPPGATVGTIIDTGGRLAGTIRTTAAQEAYDFYVGALPAAGYTVGSANLAAGVGAITFSGAELEDGQLAFTGNSIAVQLDPR